MSKRKPTTEERKVNKLLSSIRFVDWPIKVRVCVPASDHEGGSDGGCSGDVLLRATVGRADGRACRYDIANKLRELADHVINTTGDPMISAEVFVLMRRPWKEKESEPSAGA